MRLTSQEEYGMRCVLALARRYPDKASIRAVAEDEGLSADYTAKLLQRLRHDGLLTSTRGAQGGYVLARPPEEITASEVLLALDSPMFSDTFCTQHNGNAQTCVHTGACRLKGLWQAMSLAAGRVAQSMTIRQLLAGGFDE